MSAPGRNDPCPCGSGRKYKKCCLASTDAAAPPSHLLVQRLRQAEGRLMGALLAHADRHYGETAIDEAWFEFLLWDEERIDRYEDEGDDTEQARAAEEILDAETEALFMPWFLYNWLPEPEDYEDGTEAHAYPPMRIAEHYARQRGTRLDALERRFIEEACRAPFSFFSVVDAEPGRSLRLRDLLRQTEVTVQERSASQSVPDGTILYARVMSMDGVSIMFGCAPLQIPPQFLRDIVEWCNGALADFESARELLGHEDFLQEYEDEIRGLYLDIRDDALHPPPPQIQNTDGEDLEITTLYYALRCTPQEAFEALEPLAVGIAADELLAAAERDEFGALRDIELPWLRPGNAINPGMQNTALAQLRISGGTLTADVNSRERAERTRAEIEARLGERARYERAVIQSMESLRERGANAARTDDEEHLESLPEVQEQVRAVLDAHWAAWPDMALPALNGQTPREASRTPAGRELLEALFAQFEQQDERGLPGGNQLMASGPRIATLRREFGME